MKDKTIVILIFICALVLAAIGYYIANPIKFKTKSKSDFIFTTINDDIISTNKYSVKISSKENDDEKSLIEVSIDYNKDDQKVDYSFEMNFNKLNGELINKEEIYSSELVLNNDELKNMIDDIIKKCISEKLYKVNSLSMSYYSSYSSNIK